MDRTRRSYAALYNSVRAKTKIVVILFACSLAALVFRARLAGTPHAPPPLIAVVALNGCYCAFVCFLHRILSLSLFMLGRSGEDSYEQASARVPSGSGLETATRWVERLWPFALGLYGAAAALYVHAIVVR